MFSILDQVIEVPIAPVKIILDKLVSLALVVITAPVWIVICLASAVERAISPSARGGVLHREVRVSSGRPFTLWKFRILTAAGEAAIRDGAVPKDVENDPRNLTRVGWALKKVGFDELPQLLSVLMGKMSLVGPRPKPVPEYEDELRRGHIFRAVLRAGLTGPTQAMKGSRRTGAEKDTAEFEYLERMRHGSQLQILVTDLRILARTIRVVLGAYGE